MGNSRNLARNVVGKVRKHKPSPLSLCGAQTGNGSSEESAPQEQDRTLPSFRNEPWTSPTMPSFCAQPQGGVAESIIQRMILVLRERGGLSQKVADGRGRVFPHPSSTDGRLLPRDIFFLRILKQWILQLRVKVPFVQNDKCEAMGTGSQVSVTGWSFCE